MVAKTRVTSVTRPSDTGNALVTVLLGNLQGEQGIVSVVVKVPSHNRATRQVVEEARDVLVALLNAATENVRNLEVDRW